MDTENFTAKISISQYHSPETKDFFDIIMVHFKPIDGGMLDAAVHAAVRSKAAWKHSWKCHNLL